MKKWIIFLWIIFNSIPLMNPGASLPSEGEDALEVTVKGVNLKPMGENSVVILVDLKGEMALPILIGFSEARAIGLKINDIKTIRPMTHDLINSILDRLKAPLARVVINKVEGDIIYSILYFTLDGSEIQVDSRPSDAIALALRAEAPIFVSREVFKAVGVELGESGREDRFVMGQGLSVQKMTPLLAKYFGLESPEGVLVSDVKPGSPAEGAGLKTGDVIIDVNGKRIKSMGGFKSIVQDIGEGERINLLVRRGGDSIPLVMRP
ncbi:MAG: bifunctional nuclease family protein [Syntrophobacterales bacterium]|nr:MAG: bifunctional nuclease family protein [Syntrophobacterales bacterium]